VAIYIYIYIYVWRCVQGRVYYDTARWSVVFDPVTYVEDSFLLGVIDILLRELGMLITMLFLEVFASYI
jgi:hypothetical protein